MFYCERLDPLMVCDERGTEGAEYEDLIYDGVFSLVDDLLKLSDDPETICITDNAPGHKTNYVFKFLHENQGMT